MKFINSLKKLVIPLVFLLNFPSDSFDFSTISGSQTNQEVIKYVENHLEDIMHEEEQKLGIKFSGKPKIVFSYEDEFDKREKNKTATYSSKKDTIFLPIYDNLTRELMPRRNYLHKVIYQKERNVSDIDEILWHELGHFYLNKKSKSLGLGNFPDEKEWFLLSELPKIAGEQFIREGIAEYFGKKTGGKNCESFDYSKINKDPLTFLINLELIYNLGCILTREVMDEYGVGAIDYMLRNPPIIDIPEKDLFSYFEDMKKFFVKFSGKIYIPSSLD